MEVAEGGLDRSEARVRRHEVWESSGGGRGGGRGGGGGSGGNCLPNSWSAGSMV